MNPVGVTEKGTCKEICECFFHIPRFCRKTDPEFSTRQIERPICPYKITLSFNQTKTFRNDPSNLPSDRTFGRNKMHAPHSSRAGNCPASSRHIPPERPVDRRDCRKEYRPGPDGSSEPQGPPYREQHSDTGTIYGTAYGPPKQCSDIGSSF